MRCRLPMRIGTASGGGDISYPDGAFVPVTKFTDGKTYALVSKIDGVYRFINTTAFNNYTMNATVVEVTEKSGYVLFGSEPATFVAKASGDGFTLGNDSNYLHGTTSSGTALRYGTTSAVWKVDTSETGGFDSGKYLPKEVSSSVWLKNTSGGYDWCIKFESAGSFGYDRAGRDNTYSTGFVSFILYEKYEGQTGGGSGGGSGGTVALTVTHDGTADNDVGGYVAINGTTIAKGTTVEVAVGTVVDVTAGGYDSANSYIKLNGVEVARGTAAQPYKYTIQENTTISYAYKNSAGVVTITTGDSGGDGSTTPSEYALTYSITGTNRLCTIKIGSASEKTFPTTATTEAVPAGTSIKVTISSVYQQSRMTIKYNGATVATGTSSNSSPSYTFELTANTTVKVTQNGSGTSSYPTCDITTE